LKYNILKNLGHYTKKNYRLLISLIFFLIYGRVRNPKKIDSLNVRRIKRINLTNVSKFNYKLYEINDARIFTNYVENVSVISNNVLIKDISFQQINGRLVSSKYNQTVKTGTPKLLREFPGTIMLLTQGASGHTNYSHWLLDILTKIKLASMIINIKKVDFFYFSKLNKFQKESLNILGINSKKIIDSNLYRHIKGEKIVAVSHPNYSKGTIFDAHSKIPVWIIKYLRKEFLKYIKNKKINYQKIFIDRSDSKVKHCKLINNDEIVKFLRSQGFRILKLSKLNFIDQINIFNNSKIIIGPHGAGLVNLVFCNKKTKVIEIKPHDHPNKVYERISKINKLNYKLLKLKKIKNNINGDMLIKIKDLEKLI